MYKSQWLENHFSASLILVYNITQKNRIVFYATDLFTYLLYTILRTQNIIINNWSIKTHMDISVYRIINLWFHFSCDWTLERFLIVEKPVGKDYSYLIFTNDWLNTLVFITIVPLQLVVTKNMNYTVYEDLFRPGTELQEFKFKNVSLICVHF